MSLTKNIIHLALAAALFASLGACTVVPAYPGTYRAAPVYVEPYPTYRSGYPSTSIYYQSGQRHYDGRGDNYYRDDRRRQERRYQEPRRMESPLENAARTHRDVRRSLGLPRLPGMP